MVPNRVSKTLVVVSSSRSSRLLCSRLIGSVFLAYLLFVCAYTVPLAAQTSSADDTARAIQLFQQGQNDEAKSILNELVRQDRKNLRAWHYLGLALEKRGELKEAQKAHEKAARLADVLLDHAFDQLSAPDDVTDVLQPLRVQLSEAAESARRYTQLADNLSHKDRLDWTDRADSLQSFADVADIEPDGQTVFKPGDVDVKAHIISRPLPTYTEEARQQHIRGTIVIGAVLGANGTVQSIRPITTLPAGLTAKAIRATQLIKFVPALKNGQPVSTRVQVEYGFNIY